MTDSAIFFTGVIKTKTHVMSARKHGTTFYTSLGADMKIGDVFEYDGFQYEVLDVIEAPYATEIETRGAQ